MPVDDIDYSNTVFYKIYCKDPAVKDLYVGHTTNFVQRKYHHKRTCIKENDSNHNLKVYKFIRENGGWDNWKMEMIGYKDCYDHYEARKAEQKYFETLKATLNSIEPLPKPKPRPTQNPKEKQVWYCDVCRTTCQTEKALIVHEETNKHKCNLNRRQMNEMTNNKIPKNGEKYICKTCNFECFKQSNYDKHLMTAKHKRLINTNNKIPKNAQTYSCECGKVYLHNSSLWKHKNKCSLINNTISVQENPEEKSSMMEILSQNKELMNLLVVQNKEHREEISKLQNTIQEMINDRSAGDGI